MLKSSQTVRRITITQISVDSDLFSYAARSPCGDISLHAVSMKQAVSISLYVRNDNNGGINNSSIHINLNNSNSKSNADYIVTVICMFHEWAEECICAS